MREQKRLLLNGISELPRHISGWGKSFILLIDRILRSPGYFSKYPACAVSRIKAGGMCGREAPNARYPRSGPEAAASRTAMRQADESVRAGVSSGARARLNEPGGGRDGARSAMSVVREPRGRYGAEPRQKYALLVAAVALLERNAGDAERMNSWRSGIWPNKTKKGRPTRAGLYQKQKLYFFRARGFAKVLSKLTL